MIEALGVIATVLALVFFVACAVLIVWINRAPWEDVE